MDFHGCNTGLSLDLELSVPSINLYRRITQYIMPSDFNELANDTIRDKVRTLYVTEYLRSFHGRHQTILAVSFRGVVT